MINGYWWGIGIGLVVVLCGACDRPAPPVAPAPPTVTAMQVIRRDTPVATEVIAGVKAFQEVEIRSRVGGMLDRVAFREGHRVRKGDLLFAIDPLPFDAAVADAAAKLAEAEANMIRARQDVERYRPLLVDNAIPRQTYDLAVAQEKQAVSVVASKKALLDRAKLDRSYAEILSPITGQIGLQNVEVGSVVSAGQTVLATVSTLDPVYVYFSVSETSLLERMRQRPALAQKDSPEAANVKVEFLFSDGGSYDQPGAIDFADRAIDAATGTLLLRAKFANPSHFLLPGMNGRIRITYDLIKDARLVPQKAVTELLGKEFVNVLRPDNTIEVRPVTMGSRSGELWVVAAGLSGEERIVVDGLQKVQAGTVVAPTLITEEGTPGAAPPVEPAVQP
ncbi:efflux RND transporter periplasmic adaptor subunit [Desulfoprunum benzoelyticum]|uniref:Membrane fusion protein (Multidrug efflux system) n=1 Tax=Desulfoprunum benzoelyticum TaxID=1506996 RepID=A0A840ULG8_9BACT|nr:membrane fusion protein (multidrug efflux system) [Desulfoprunum benzoelyticum]MBM9531374.1 efflux RND transporter periplasmic adaptor subunit [Desulfoprunum benzoelyticum]